MVSLSHDGAAHLPEKALLLHARLYDELLCLFLSHLRNDKLVPLASPVNSVLLLSEQRHLCFAPFVQLLLALVTCLEARLGSF